MKILLLQDAEWRKKGPHQQHHLMELLSLRGHQIRVIGFDQLWSEEEGGIISKRIVDEDISRFYKNAKVTFIRPFFLRIPLIDYVSYFFSSLIEIRRQVQDFEPNVIIGFSSIISNLWGALFAKRKNIPYIYYWYDIVHKLNVPKPFGLIAVLIEKIIINKSTSVIVINDALRDYIINFGAPESITRVIPGGIDPDKFDTSRSDRDLIRKQFRIDNKDLVLFFMGWIYEFSGLDKIVIELFNSGEIASRIKLIIVGEGDDYLKIKNLVKNYNMENRVIMTGKRHYEEIPGLISASDICILPAVNNEVMRFIVPIKMYEYLAMAKPVISTCLPGIFKEFGNNSGVIYVQRPDDVVKKAMQLTEEDLLINQRRANDFIRKHDWNVIISDFENVLISLAGSSYE